MLDHALHEADYEPEQPTEAQLSLWYDTLPWVKKLPIKNSLGLFCPKCEKRLVYFVGNRMSMDAAVTISGGRQVLRCKCKTNCRTDVQLFGGGSKKAKTKR